MATELPQRPATRSIAGWAALLVAAVVLAYADTFRCPFVLDDVAAIVENPSIRDLRRWTEVLWPPSYATTAGRPLLNATFAANWWIGGPAVWTYHLANLAIHAGSALLAFGIVRRLAGRYRADATLFGFFAALLWAVHPVNTEAVTYISQRAESLMGCLYLATLYGFVRATTDASARWLVMSAVSCALGMMVKEVMVTAPVFVLLLDRAFFARSFAEAVRARRAYYAALALTWVLLAGMMVAAKVDTWSDGAARGVGVGTYALNEAYVLVRYVLLAVWPSPLVFDYGTGIYLEPTGLKIACAAGLVALAVLLWLRGRRMPGVVFAVVAFLLLLAPTSSVVPVALQPMAESRLYLPSLMIATAGVTLATTALGRRAGLLFALVALALTVQTSARNRLYRSEVTLWADSVAKFPHSDRARNNLGLALSAVPGREREARAQFEAAIRLDPQHAEAHYNLGNLLAAAAETDTAEKEFATALACRPEYRQAHTNFGLLLQRLGRLPEAIAHLETAARLPGAGGAEHSNLASAYLDVGRRDEALREYATAAGIEPSNATLHFNFANALLSAGRPADAAAEYAQATLLRPDYVEARFNRAVALAQAGDRASALAELERVTRLRPADAALQQNAQRLREALGGP